MKYHLKMLMKIITRAKSFSNSQQQKYFNKSRILDSSIKLYNILLLFIEKELF